MKFTKEQRFSIVSSLIFLIGFTGLLLIFGFSAPFPPPEEEGILINFGNTETGSGRIEPKPSEEVAQVEDDSDSEDNNNNNEEEEEEEEEPEPEPTPPPTKTKKVRRATKKTSN